MISPLALLLAGPVLAADPIEFRAGKQQIQTERGAFTLTVDRSALEARDAIHAARRQGPPLDPQEARRCNARPRAELSVAEFERDSEAIRAKEPRASTMLHVTSTGDIIGVFKWRGFNCQAYQIHYFPISADPPAELRLSRGEFNGETVLCVQAFDAQKRETERFVVQPFDYFKEQPGFSFRSLCGTYVGS